MSNATNCQTRRLVSPADIARKLNRTQIAVGAAIRRLGLTPVAQSGRYRFFDPEIIPTVDNAMRRPNRKDAK